MQDFVHQLSTSSNILRSESRSFFNRNLRQTTNFPPKQRSQWRCPTRSLKMMASMKKQKNIWRLDIDMGVSKNRGTPKCMVYNGKPYQIGWLEDIPLFSETSIFGISLMFLKSTVPFIKAEGLLEDGKLPDSNLKRLWCLHFWRQWFRLPGPC